MLRDWGLPKAPAVALVVVISSIIILGMGVLVAQQVTQLGEKLPEYQFNIEKKIRSLREAAGGGTLG
jgi:predicted PurR-regulated permease PerM